MATAAQNSRTSFEIRANFAFIAKSLHPPTYAEKFARFFNFERLRRHHSGRFPMHPSDVDQITKDCCEWIDPKTNPPKRRATWHGFNTFADLAKEIGEEEAYEKHYGTTSAFTHASYATHRAYLRGQSMQPVASSTFVSQQSLLTVGNVTLFLLDYVKFFGVAAPRRDFIEILHKVRAIQARVAPERT